MKAYRLKPDRTTTDRAGRRLCEVFGRDDGHEDASVSWLMLPAGCKGVEEANDYTEIVIVLSGLGAACVGGRDEAVGAGHALHAPRGVPWRLANTGREPLVCWSIRMPAPAGPVH